MLNVYGNDPNTVMNLYQRSSYRINNALRTNLYINDIPDKQVIKDIYEMDNIIKNFPVDDKIVLYRGNPKIKTLVQKKDATSSIFVDTAFSSFTTDYNIAKTSFTKDWCCILAIVITKESNIHYYKLQNSPEKEVLLERNLQFIIGDRMKNQDIECYKCIVKKYDVPIISENEIDNFKYI